MSKTCTLKTIKHCLKIVKKTQRDVKPSCVHGLEDLVTLRCQHYSKQSIDLM